MLEVNSICYLAVLLNMIKFISCILYGLLSRRVETSVVFKI